MTIPINITLDDLERLAHELETDTEQQRARLARLCAAYHRILRAREPQCFQRAACHHGDVAGHFDSSYPPEQVYSDWTGPRVLEVTDSTIEDVATSTGFYYEWRRVTNYGGLWLGYDAQWYRVNETGTGRVGQFAAHPGDCGVHCILEWLAVSTDDLSLAELNDAEAKLRALAFPAATARANAS